MAYAPYGRRRCTERRHACGDARSGVRVPVALVAWRWRHIGGCHRTGQDVLASCTTAAPPQERTIGRPYPTYYYAAADAIDWLKDTPSSRLFDRGPCLQGVGSLARCVARLGWLTGWIMSASKRARRVGACPAAVARVARHHRRSRHLCSSGNVEPKDPFRNGTPWFARQAAPPQSHRGTRCEAQTQLVAYDIHTSVGAFCRRRRQSRYPLPLASLLRAKPPLIVRDEEQQYRIGMNTN